MAEAYYDLKKSADDQYYFNLHASNHEIPSSTVNLVSN